jgi:S-adenosylmethionine:tRNA ribosyltransferase-isomerase
MNVRDFDYDLPPELIAQKPLPRRDASRMMVVRRSDGAILHKIFRDLPEFIESGDLLVLNDTKVLPAKAWGKRGNASIEFLFIRELESGTWEVLCKPARRVGFGDRIVFGEGFEAMVIGVGEEGRRKLRFDAGGVIQKLGEIGFAPLPPYIKRKKADRAIRAEDLDRYQTVFAAHEGAIAAPTAGLHFTQGIFARLRAKGARISPITLHVGLATFQPLRVESVEDHKMLAETYSVPESTVAEIQRTRAIGQSVVAVGTTVVRALESAAGLAAPPSPPVAPGTRATSLFIYPGFAFRVVDKLVTNFHLPKSTLLMLVSAFAGRDLVLSAYREAVRERYRFFSYGDVMLIL